MIETALVLPLLLLVVFNAINFGYYFLVAIHLASAPRQGVQYSVMGFATPGALSLPAAGPETNAATVSYLTFQDMHSLVGTRTTATVRVCTYRNGTSGSGATQRANCTEYGPAPNPAFAAMPADPEAPFFLAHRVDVQYTVAPLIAAAPFGLTVLPTYTFHRQVTMRMM